jgi:hypothetical protein
MTFNLEIMQRGNERVFTEALTHERDPEAWTDADVRAVLSTILQALDRVLNPGVEQRSVSLRGMSWIVSPYQDGVVIALEIHSAAAVAGPFHIGQDALDDMIQRAIAGTPTTGGVH